MTVNWKHDLYIFPLLINKRATREELPKMHKYGSIPRDFNKDTATSGSFQFQYTFKHHQTKVNSVHLNDTCYFSNTRDTNN